MATFISNGTPITSPSPQYDIPLVTNNGVLKARHQSGLPLGYQLLSSLTSDGRCLVDTGIVLQEGDEIDLDYSLANPQPSSLPADRFLFGTANADVSKGGTWAEVYSGSGDISSSAWYVRFSSSASANGNLPATALSGHLTLKQEQLIINDATLLTPGYIGTFQTTSLTFFGRYDANQTGYKGAEMTVSHFTVKNGGAYRFNGVMVKRFSDNALGVYDFVSGTFCENIGDGTFTAGNAVSDPVEIYTDGTVEKINVHGKNLFNLAGSTYDKFLNAQGEEQPGVFTSFSNAYTDYIPVKPNTVYTLSLKRVVNVESNHRIHGYTEGKAWIAQVGNVAYGTASVGARVSTTITTPANCHWLRINYIYSPAGETPQLELDSTATEYEPYFNGGTATAEMLLKVGNYQDVQSIIDGVVTRNVGVKVLDGTENFETATATNCYSLTNTLGTGNFADRTIVCSHFASTPTLPGTGDRQGLAFIVNKGQDYTIAFGATTQFSTQALWQQFLAAQYAAGTPVIIIYPLATPTTETVTGQTLQVTDGDNVLEITQASLNGLELEAEYEKTV